MMLSSNHCHCAFKSNNWRAEQPLTITVVKTVTRKNLLKKRPQWGKETGNLGGNQAQANSLYMYIEIILVLSTELVM